MNCGDRRFGVPYSCPDATVWIMGGGDAACICSADLSAFLTAHDVTWSCGAGFCEEQYEELPQLEEMRIPRLRTLDRVVDETAAFMPRGERFPGKKLKTVSLQTGKVKAIEPMASQKE